LRRAAGLFIWGPLAYSLAFSQFFLLFLSAQALLYFLAIVVVALVFNYVALVPVVALRTVSRFLMRIRLQAVPRWINRSTWIMVILPVQLFMLATKASANLVSVTLTDGRRAIRGAGVLGLVGIYLGFLLLTLFCELLIIPPLAPVFLNSNLEGTFDAPTFLTLYVVFVTLCLGIWKASLAPVDLLLDICNYHLASRTDRIVYFRRIEEGVDSLRQAGCSEIHVLAHSLGSVIMYDWLRSLSTGTCPVSAFHTIGSPLDKFWYIDRSRRDRREDERGLISARLPKGWINYWADSDPISGRLNHYGKGSSGVFNLQLRKLGPWLVSHTRYWTNRAVTDSVRERIVATATPV